MHRVNHGLWRTPAYTSWDGIIQRCTNPKHPHWELYGGRGIKVCKRWRESFLAFFADMGQRPIGTTIDRYPNMNGNYEPGNCRWATHEQQHNNKRTNVFVEYKGISMTISQLGREVGVYPEKLAIRLRRGWPLERAIIPLKMNRWK